MSANNFKLTLDTIAPVGSFVLTDWGDNETIYINTSKQLSLNKGDASFMKIWYDGSASTSTIPSTYGNNTTLNWIPAAATYTMSFHADGEYYCHVAFMDDVGNISSVAHSKEIMYETQRPTFVTVDNKLQFYAYDLDDTDTTRKYLYTNSATFGFHFKVADTGTTQSLVDHVVLRGNFTGSPKTLSGSDINSSGEPASTLNLTFTSGATHGEQIIYGDVYDKAGNHLASEVSTSIIYDPDPVGANLALQKNGSALAQYINAANNSFDVVITLQDGVDPDSAVDTDVVGYKYWGGLTGHTSEPSTWTTWPTTSGTANTSVTLSSQSFTTGDETKSVYAKVIDRAGNITSLGPITRVYDNTAPADTPSTPTATSNDIWVGQTNPSSPANRSNTDTIANGNGTINSTTVYFYATDATAGVASVAFMCNSTNFASGTHCYDATAPSSGNVWSGSWTFKGPGATGATTGAVVGTNTVTMRITDRAGNYRDYSVTIVVENSFTIDSLTITGHELYSNIFNYSRANSALGATFVCTDLPTSSWDTYYAWIDTTANNTTAAGNARTWASSGGTSQVVANNLINKSLADNATNYLHIKAVSKTGLVAYKHATFTIDSIAPTLSASISSTSTSSRTNTIVVAGSGSTYDNAGGVGLDCIKIAAKSGTSLQTGAIDWTNYTAGNYTVTLSSSTQDGTYGVIVYLRDKANNSTSQELTWEYDKTAPAVAVDGLVLKESDGTTGKVSPTAINTVRAQITFASPDATDDENTLWYKIYGDIATTASGAAITESNAEWVPFHTDNTNLANGEQARISATTTITEIFYCTAAVTGTDGDTKTIRVKLKDNAGNISSEATASFIYNPRRAELFISEVSHPRISCSHIKRKTTSGGNVVDESNIIIDYDDSSSTTADRYTIEDYADVVAFKVKSGETGNGQTIVEWKVAAYTTYPSSDVSGETVTAMTKRNGSYSTTGYSNTIAGGTKVWHVVIDGQDYRTALGGSASTNKDGLHYIVVFGKNQAGLWSLAGTVTEIDW